jgi:pyruvate/2-oxoglutarate dehydrogenase complex dihydrolipoamide dehydrogenase (E3) component
MLVIGGGIIGLEMATLYSTLGARIDVVEMLDGLMQGADRDPSSDLVNSVSTKPGAIAFTVMSSFATSRASERVKPPAAALDAA